jgi:hypothetical protein
MKIVKMGDGCGRMQNRMLTFRDASKACARYRLNIDQMQGVGETTFCPIFVIFTCVSLNNPSCCKESLDCF